MMKIAFASQDEAYIRQQVEQGFYSNATELVRDAVRRLRESSQQRDPLVAALAVGEKAITEGRIFPHTPELMGRLKQEALRNAKDGLAVSNPDVIA